MDWITGCFVFSRTSIINYGRKRCYALLSSRYTACSLLTSTPNGGKWLVSHPGKRAPSTHWMRGWLVPRDSLEDLIKKIISCLWQEELKPVSLVIQFTEWDCLIAMCNMQLQNWFNFKLKHLSPIIIIQMERYSCITLLNDLDLSPNVKPLEHCGNCMIHLLQH
jgi:hypothetical protein